MKLIIGRYCSSSNWPRITNLTSWLFYTRITCIVAYSQIPDRQEPMVKTFEFVIILNLNKKTVENQFPLCSSTSFNINFLNQFLSLSALLI